MTLRAFAFAFVALAFAFSADLSAQSLDFDAAPRPTDSIALESLPRIGLWMLDGAGGVAHWLGESIKGRTLQEPINLVIVDSISKTKQEALARLVAACEKSEFEKRSGHSSGYSAYIGGELYSQIPSEKMTAYSDGPFEFSNNHGRLFGPAAWGSGFVFIGAFSREHTNLMTRVKHLFSSFTMARDAFARAMERSGHYEIAGFLPLGNAIVASTEFTTGDHDGVAILLMAVPTAAAAKDKRAPVPIEPAPEPVSTPAPATPTNPVPAPSAATQGAAPEAEPAR
jgi:hypothetical protein